MVSTQPQDRWQRIAARKRQHGEGMLVARLLPTRERRMIGAWCFLDHLGPVAFQPGQGLHVGAHPHTRLQTFTWMVEGEILHRDSLGSEQVLRPGQVNLMTAGRGISHTEDSVRDGEPLHAVQLWLALPPEQADQLPAFEHYPGLPRWQEQGCQWVLMAGRYGAHQAPVQIFSPVLGMELHAPRGATLSMYLQPDFEHGLLALQGGFVVEGHACMVDELLYLAPGLQQLQMQLAPGTRLLVLGGQPWPSPVLMWWNFLGADWQAIRHYRQLWEQGDACFGSVLHASRRRIAAPPLPDGAVRPQLDPR